MSGSSLFRGGLPARSHLGGVSNWPYEFGEDRGEKTMSELPTFSLAGKTALVTGAGRGLGRAIALALAASFGGYGLVKKTAPLPSLEGLAAETAVLFLPAAAYLVVVDGQGTGAFLHNGVITDVLLIAAGAITIVPLLLFASAVRRVPLSVIGVLQYISPTIQFLLGVLVIREPFNRTQLSGFVLVWMGLLVFGLDGVPTRRTATVAAVLDEGAA